MDTINSLIALGANAWVDGVAEHVSACRGPSTGWRCHSAAAAGASQYWDLCYAETCSATQVTREIQHAASGRVHIRADPFACTLLVHQILTARSLSLERRGQRKSEPAAAGRVATGRCGDGPSPEDDHRNVPARARQ